MTFVTVDSPGENRRPRSRERPSIKSATRIKRIKLCDGADFQNPLGKANRRRLMDVLRRGGPTPRVAMTCYTGLILQRSPRNRSPNLWCAKARPTPVTWSTRVGRLVIENTILPKKSRWRDRTSAGGHPLDASRPQAVPRELPAPAVRIARQRESSSIGNYITDMSAFEFPTSTRRLLRNPQNIPQGGQT